ncbi:hypothetical protein [Magnetospirillum sp. SS-4]|uniref:hypothetical protein n=1 Tax=Magnetospirillum sp. SS-4 TaxID=2681465 RepID=UPI00137CFBC3|nr:hypothetical protein [Magnetospirillum sp. SS-4]CAA7626995.1 conserved hypothetical protein [Magnetospirillum sp. SS-4]
MINEILSPDAAFSRAVYTRIRQAIPRSQWPAEALRATFTPSPDGLSLESSFEGLPPQAAMIASNVVRQAKVDLVLASPAARLAVAVVRARRWRDTFLYGLLPLLFAIPLMAALAPLAMRISMGLCAIDAAALFASHAALLQSRSRLVQCRFIAHIPTPGLRIKTPQGAPLSQQT